MLSRSYPYPHSKTQREKRKERKERWEADPAAGFSYRRFSSTELAIGSLGWRD